MGSRKKNSAELRKAAKAATCTANLVARPTSPRKMRLVVDTIRGMELEKAINVLSFTNRETAEDLLKLVKSAANNWEQKFGTSAADSDLYIKEISVDAGRMLKRFLPAPMGRAYRVRKRSNHVSIELASKSGVTVQDDTNSDNE